MSGEEVEEGGGVVGRRSKFHSYGPKSLTWVMGVVKYHKFAVGCGIL